jgi:hypothetical protein
MALTARAPAAKLRAFASAVTSGGEPWIRCDRERSDGCGQRMQASLTRERSPDFAARAQRGKQTETAKWIPIRDASSRLRTPGNSDEGGTRLDYCSKTFIFSALQIALNTFVIG